MDEEQRVAARERPDQVHPNRRGWVPVLATILGLALIGLWVTAWIASIRKDTLVVGQSTWVPAMPFFGADFKVHIDHVARLQAAGMDPYHMPDDRVCSLYPYPPMLGRFFAWVVLFDKSTAACLWQGALGLILAAGGLAAWRTRRESGLDSIPPALIVAAILFSSPALFAVERGQADPMIILPMIASAWLLRRGAWSEIAAGGLLGLTAWLKYYPGLVVVALFALGKRRGLAAFVVVAVSIGIVDLDGFRQSIKQAKLSQAFLNGPYLCVPPMNHSIVERWTALSFVQSSGPLQQIPGTVVAAALLLPAIVLVSRIISRSVDAGALTYPYLLWLTSAATFAMPSSNDYNLATLPIATLAVWDRRDRLSVHLPILFSILWSQPFWLPLSGEIVLGLKLGALYAVGASLASRASRVAVPVPLQPETSLFHPAFTRVYCSPAKSVAFTGEHAPGSRRS
jgi:Glycosyltransferase family 87